MYNLVLITTSYQKNFPVTNEQREILLDYSTTEKELKSAELFKEITKKDINDFVCSERGHWCFKD